MFYESYMVALLILAEARCAYNLIEVKEAERTRKI